VVRGPGGGLLVSHVQAGLGSWLVGGTRENKVNSQL
jgi:hypothetical protein